MNMKYKYTLSRSLGHLCFPLQAGKILLYYKDQTKDILIRFTAWCCFLVSNLCSSLKFLPHVYFKEIKCLAAADSSYHHITVAAFFTGVMERNKSLYLNSQVSFLSQMSL